MIFLVKNRGVILNDFDENELEVNKKNREDYEQLMRDSSSNLDGYWDKNNSFVKILLIVLLVIIVVGSIYVLVSSATK